MRATTTWAITMWAITRIAPTCLPARQAGIGVGQNGPAPTGNALSRKEGNTLGIPGPCEYVVLPWDLVTRHHLSDPLRCTYALILSLAWGNDRRRTPPTSRRQLAEMRGLSMRAIDNHLRALRQKALVLNEPGRVGLPLVLVPVHLAQWAAAPQAVSQPHPPHPLAAPAECDRPESTVLPNEPQEPSQMGAAPAVRDTPVDVRIPEINAKRSYEPLESPSTACSESLEEEGETCTIGKERLLLTIQHLVSAGVYSTLARKLARRPWVTPDLVDAWAQELRANRKVRHVGAVLATLLRRRETCLPPPEISDEDTPVEAFAVEPTEEVDDLDAPDAAPGEALPNAVPARSRATWDEVLNRLRQLLGDEAVNVWLGQSVPISCEDDVLVVAVRSARAVDWLGHRYYTEIRDVLRQVTGEPLQLRFVAARLNVLPKEPWGAD